MSMQGDTDAYRRWLEDEHEKGLAECDREIEAAENYDPHSIEGDVVSVMCQDGVRRNLTIAEYCEPGLMSHMFGSGCAKIYTEDGRQIGTGYDGAGWLEHGDVLL